MFRFGGLGGGGGGFGWQNASAMYGRFRAFGVMVVCILICVVLLTCGSIALKTTAAYSGRATGKVKSVNCTNSKDASGNDVRGACYAVIEYKVKGESKPRTLQTTGSPSTRVGDQAELAYDPKNPDNTIPSASRSSMMPMGIVSVVCAFCVCLVGVLIFVVMMKHKALATGYGAVSAIRNLT